MEYGHKSVLLHESIDGLAIQAGDTYLDATLGSGGHAEEVTRRFGTAVRIIGLDMDVAALKRSKERLLKIGAKAEFVQGNFRDLNTILDKLGVEKVNRIMFDLGLSSNQIQESGRGFSFQKNEPLAMTFTDKVDEGVTTAEIVVNEWSEETLAVILKGFGEERYAKRIAKVLVATRRIRPIKTTGDLVEIISSAVPASYRRGRLHFATRTFQAIRIAVNDELGALAGGLHEGFSKLVSGGRMAVISFHSLEDRIVKNFFRNKAKEDVATLITKKPIVPSEKELIENRRARSAKLRIIEKR